MDTLQDWVGRSLFGGERYSAEDTDSTDKGEGSVEFINLTPHDIQVKVGDETIKIPKSGNIARVDIQERDTGKELNGIPLKERKTGRPQGIPGPKRGTYYIVSSMVLSSVDGRDDVIAPDTGKDAVRDDSGRIQAVRSFVRGR